MCRIVLLTFSCILLEIPPPLVKKNKYPEMKKNVGTAMWHNALENIVLIKLYIPNSIVLLSKLENLALQCNITTKIANGNRNKLIVFELAVVKNILFISCYINFFSIIFSCNVYRSVFRFIKNPA